MKTVVITGCSGFIGSHIANYYINKDFNVIGIDRSKKNDINDKINFLKIDLEHDDATELYKKVRPDYYIHCAGNASVGVSVEYPELDFQKNVNVLYKILSSLKRSQCNPKFIFLSSAAVYGNPIKLPIEETDKLKPISPYGLHKKICEDICNYFKYKESMNITIIRIFSAYGEGLKKQILWDMYRKLKDKGKIELFGTGDETRDFINIIDIIQAIDLILNAESAKGVYNVANGDEITIKNLAYKFILSYGLDKNVIDFNKVSKEGDPLNWRADISRLKRLGYKKTVDINTGINLYVNWLRSIKDD